MRNHQFGTSGKDEFSVYCKKFERRLTVLLVTAWVLAGIATISCIGSFLAE